MCVAAIALNLVPDLPFVLADTQPAPPEELPQTGLSPDRELALSSVFVRTPDYGTVDARGRFTLRNLNL